MDIHKHFLLIIILLLIAPSYCILAQNNSEKNDTELFHLYKLQDFYLAQLRKDYIADTLKHNYRIKLADVEKKINKQQAKTLKRILNSADSVQLMAEEKRKQDFRAVDLEMKNESEPITFANEIKSWAIYGGIGFSGINYSIPVSLGIDRVFSEKLSGGLLLQRSSENLKEKEYDDSLTSYTVYTSSYKYHYTSFNARFNYHITIPAVDFEYFDLYASAIVGYNLTIKSQNSVEPDVIAEPSRDGVNFGLMAGAKFMWDKNMGVYAELGYSRINYFSVGLVYRIVPPAAKKVKIALTEEELRQLKIEKEEMKLQKKTEAKEKSKNNKNPETEKEKKEEPVNEDPNPENKPE